jgi:hypothetical protein
MKLGNNLWSDERFAHGDAATLDGARYDIISILGKPVTLVTSRSVDAIGAGVGLHVRSWHV